MSEIEYFRIEGLEVDYFHCERLRATLSVPTCASRHRAAADGETHISCFRCPVGAKHCGKPVEPPSVLASRICARCFKQAQRMVHGRLCVSCYNRTRETEKGANAKGGKPKKLAAVYTGVVAVERADGSQKVAQVESVSGFVEAVVSAARSEGGSKFSWASVVRKVLLESGLRRRQPCQ